MDRDNSLTSEGNTESELRNSLLVADQWQARATLIMLYRKQCAQNSGGWFVAMSLIS
jgi:hypothetical protein